MRTDSPGRAASTSPCGAVPLHALVRRHLVLASLLVVAFMAITALISPSAAAGAIGVKMAVGVVIGDIKESTTPTGHDVRDVSDAVTMLDTSYWTPLDQLLRRMRKRGPASNTMVEWLRRDRTPPRRDATTGATGAGGAGASVALPVAKVSMWRKNDLVILPSQPGVVLLVTAVNPGANTITVYRMPEKTTSDKNSQAYATVPAIGSGVVLTRMAPSKTEADAPSASRAVTPEYLRNFIHSYDGVPIVSAHRKRTKNYGPHDWDEAEKAAVTDLRRSIEYNNIWGRPSITVDPSNNEIRMTQAGLDFFSAATINYSAGNLTELILTDWNAQIYTGNVGARTRLIMAGKQIVTDIDKALYGKTTYSQAKEKAGLMISDIETRFGRTAIVHHPGLDDTGHSNIGFCIDLSTISRAELEPLNDTPLKLRESGVKDAFGKWYQEKSTLMVADPTTVFKIVAS